MTKKINPKKGYKFNDNYIIPEKTFNNNGYRIICDEFGKQKIFLNYKINADNKKIPFKPYSYQPADYTNSEHFGTLEQAIIGVKMRNMSGIGIALSKTLKGQLCGLDIDNCIDENGNLYKEALELVKLFDSYAEISISGTGIHILFYAIKNGGSTYNRSLDWCTGMELYDNKYFTISGKCINNKHIEHRQDICDLILEKYFNSQTKENKQLIEYGDYIPFNEDYLQELLRKDAVLYKYWHREIKINNESDSDFGFLGKLCYWLKNPESVKEYFLKSPYFLRKDDFHKNKALGIDRKSSKKYLEISIANLCKSSNLGGHNV